MGTESKVTYLFGKDCPRLDVAIPVGGGSRRNLFFRPGERKSVLDLGKAHSFGLIPSRCGEPPLLRDY